MVGCLGMYGHSYHTWGHCYQFDGVTHLMGSAKDGRVVGGSWRVAVVSWGGGELQW